MAPSFHMYHNENLYEGKPVTPVETLSLCTYDRTEQGYRFAGWNTRADGTGIFYEDGDKILNLSYEDCNEDEEKGTVTLYAQWEKVRSTLIIDAGEGRYSGENPVTRNWGSFWRGDQGRLVPPAGNTIAFQTNGGNMNFSRMTGTQTFLDCNWQNLQTGNGRKDFTNLQGKTALWIRSGPCTAGTRLLCPHLKRKGFSLEDGILTADVPDWQDMGEKAVC